MQTTDADIALKLRQVRTALTDRQPFFAIIGFYMQTEFDSRVKSVTADGVTVRFNPQWFREADFDELVGVLAQKSFQCAAKHHIRMIGRDHKLANMASQLVTNPEVLKSGFVLPDGYLHDDAFLGMSFERVYNLLEKLQQEQPPMPSDDDGDGQAQPQSGAGDQQGQPNKDQGEKGDDSPQSNGEGDDNDDGSQGGDEAGGGPGEADEADGDADGDEDGSGARAGDQDDFGNCGSIQEPVKANGDRADTDLIQKHNQEWDDHVREAEMVCKRAGSLPGSSQTLTDPLNGAKQPWQEILRQWLKDTTSRQYDWMKPDRRFATQYPVNRHIPSLHSRRFAKLYIGCDTSQSVMTPRQRQVIADELNGALEEVLPELTLVIEWDTQVQQVKEYTDQDYPITLDFKGQGGTRVMSFFDYVDSADEVPVAAIIFTDLEIIDFPNNDPEFPVLWGSTKGTEAPFGDVLMLDEV
jgi:predicted metal-dependent peptidase